MAEQLGLLDQTDTDFRDPIRDGLTVRESRRARHLILQLVPPHTLEVVVPRGTRPRVVEAFVRENRHWIDSARAELVSRFRGDRDELPRQIELAAIGRSVAVEYAFGAAARSGWREFGDRLRVSCARDDAGAARAVLRQWLVRRAREQLVPWLLREAAMIGEQPSGVQLRLQRTRWGSCSARRGISLNAALLLLEPRLVRYLLVHELCHLRWMNHGVRYWRLVERFEPDYRVLDRGLSEAWTEIPLWIVEARRQGAS